MEFPRQHLRPRSERWRLGAVTIGGGVSVGGVSPMSRTDGGGLWTCEQSFLIATPAQHKAAKAFAAFLDGGAATVDVPRFVGDTAPVPINGAWALDIAFADPAALRATAATVAITVGLPLTGGETFSVDHPTKGRRTYDIISANDLAAGEQTITFRPPLREAVTDEALDFQTPSCRMRLANPQDFMGAIGVDRTAEVNAVWVEAF